MKILNANAPVWTNTMDADGHVTLYKGRKIIWEGSYEAFCSEVGVDCECPPQSVCDRIHNRARQLSTLCPDCGNAERDVGT